MTSSQIEELFIMRRSIRRFQQIPLPIEDLRKCINCARMAPSGKNLQPLEYILVTEKNIREQLFQYLHWAGYLPSFNPSIKEQPMGYIIVLVDKKSSDVILTAYDVGIALAHIVLYAEFKNIGSCILKNIDVQRIQELLQVPDSFVVDSVVALGYKDENPVPENDYKNKKYWLDEVQIMHVPKRPLSSVLHEQTFS